MKSITVAEAKSHFSVVLAEVKAGEQIAVTRRGNLVARLASDRPCIAADAFRDFWLDSAIDLEAPGDALAEDVVSLDE